ncbi:MAG: hypothetical protein H7138_22100 [Myxococcales bacterium]|nr:hypothetical protein [Myxococcales bacterium]
MRFMTLAISAATLAGCSIPDGTAQRNAELRACGLHNDPSITLDVDLHACPAGTTKKTTICHVPPGNPANVHTLCVGNSAVRAHVDNHGDLLGACVSEPPCDGGDVNAGAGSGSDEDAGPDLDGGIIS